MADLQQAGRCKVTCGHLQALKRCGRWDVVILQGLSRQVDDGRQDGVAGFQRVLLQRLALQCTQKPLQHGLLVKLGMDAKSLDKAARTPISAPRDVTSSVTHAQVLMIYGRSDGRGRRAQVTPSPVVLRIDG